MCAKLQNVGCKQAWNNHDQNVATHLHEDLDFSHHTKTWQTPVGW